MVVAVPLGVGAFKAPRRMDTSIKTLTIMDMRTQTQNNDTETEDMIMQDTDTPANRPSRDHMDLREARRGLLEEDMVLLWTSPRTAATPMADGQRRWEMTVAAGMAIGVRRGQIA